jgi:hypothetical protein
VATTKKNQENSQKPYSLGGIGSRRRVMPIHRDEDRRLFSIIKNARELISKLNRLADKTDTNGFRFKLVKLWPLTFDIRIKDND